MWYVDGKTDTSAAEVAPAGGRGGVVVPAGGAHPDGRNPGWGSPGRGRFSRGKGYITHTHTPPVDLFLLFTQNSFIIMTLKEGSESCSE